jgi:hypothetical protein
VNLSEVAMAAAITLSVAGVSYAALNTDSLTASTRTVADTATCRAVDQAIVAYVAEHNATPTTAGQIQPWVKGDVSQYRIVKGVAAGPGC